MANGLVWGRQVAARYGSGWLIFGALLWSAETSAQDRSWAVANGGWSNPNNWLPVGVPSLTDTVAVGDLAGVANGFLDLDQHDSVSGLDLRDGMVLRNHSFQLFVLGDTLVSDVNDLGSFNRVSLLDLTPVAGGLVAFDTDTLTLSNGGGLSLADGVIVEVDELLTIGDRCTLSGEGSIRLRGNVSPILTNHGTLSARRGELRIEALGSGLIDLDGDVPPGVNSTANIQVLRDTSNATPEKLTIVAPGLSDAYDESIFLTTGTILDMQLASEWTMAGWLRFSGNDLGTPGVLTGTPMRFEGYLDVDGSAAFARIDADTTLVASDVDVRSNQLLEFAGATTVEGNGNEFGVFEHGGLVFSGPTRLHGGGFYYFATPGATPPIAFEGETTFAGNIGIRGLVAQTGDATVTAASRVERTVFGGNFDLDGDGGVHQAWQIDAPLELNVDGVGNGSGDAYSGTMSIGGGSAPRLTVDLFNPLDRWSLDGTLNLTGDAKAYTRLDGAGLTIVDSGPRGPTGTVNLAGGLARIDCPITFTSGTTLNVGTKIGGATLEFTDRTVFEAGAAIAGTGGIRNSSSGEMTVAEGVTAASTAIDNHGALTVALGTNTLELATLGSGRPTSTLVFELDGSPLGIVASRVDAGIGVDLGGTLRVITPDGLPALQDGASTTLIRSPTRTGRFDTLELPYGYRWSVQYSRITGDVTLTVLERTGDMNCDGVVDFFDIDAFVTALISPAQYAVDYPACDINQADVNDDGTVDFFDIDPFVTLLVGA